MTNEKVKAYWQRWKVLKRYGAQAVTCPALVTSTVAGGEPEPCGAGPGEPCRNRRDAHTFHPERHQALDRAESDLAQLIAWEQAIRGAPKRAPRTERITRR